MSAFSNVGVCLDMGVGSVVFVCVCVCVCLCVCLFVCVWGGGSKLLANSLPLKCNVCTSCLVFPTSGNPPQPKKHTSESEGRGRG